MMEPLPEPQTLDDQARDAYWKVVEECLIRIHHLDQSKASAKANALRRQVESPPPDISGEILYHDEPFYVACDLADLHDVGEQDRILQQNQGIYESILATHNW
jgi:hypothetical protein